VKGSFALELPVLLFVDAGVSGCRAPNTLDFAAGLAVTAAW
jgi:hypothetical protein